MSKLAFIFPGQGAQKPGMGKDFYQSKTKAKEVFQLADELLKQNFSRFIFEAEASELSLTKNAQLAIYITSIAILEVVYDELPELRPIACAGLSLGEYSAITASGLTTFSSMLPVVKARGAFMDEATKEKKGTMAAVLGMDEPQVLQVLAESGLQGAWIANINCPGQIVIAGISEDVLRASTLLKEAGAKRVIPLDVSGAFHTALMNSAAHKLTPIMQELSLEGDIRIPVLSNVTGGFVKDRNQIKSLLIDQVTKPVRWEDCIHSLETVDPDYYIEMGPGKTLAGMNKKIGTSAPTISIEKIEDLELLFERV